jgi:hypothetical protein
VCFRQYYNLFSERSVHRADFLTEAMHIIAGFQHSSTSFFGLTHIIVNYSRFALVTKAQLTK